MDGIQQKKIHSNLNNSFIKYAINIKARKNWALTFPLGLKKLALHRSWDLKPPSPLPKLPVIFLEHTVTTYSCVN